MDGFKPLSSPFLTLGHFPSPTSQPRGQVGVPRQAEDVAKGVDHGGPEELKGVPGRPRRGPQRIPQVRVVLRDDRTNAAATELQLIQHLTMMKIYKLKLLTIITG